MILEDIQAKLDNLRREWKQEQDPVKRKVLEARARLLKHTTIYNNPTQKNMKWS